MVQPHQVSASGAVDPNGLSTIYYFQYGTSIAYGSATQAWNAAGTGFQPVPVNGTITGLKGNTTYHYRLIASNSAGSSTGQDQTFTTPDWRPIVKTEPATNVKGQNATLNGYVDGQGESTIYQFVYSLSSEPENIHYCGAANAGSGPIKVSEPLNNLEDGDYLFSVAATNAEGMTLGEVRSFTINNRPIVTPEAATSVGTGSATLKGKINPQAFASTYYFQYTDHAEFKERGFAGASTVPVPPASAGSGNEDVAVSQEVKELQPETTYHYRLVGTNVKGTEYSSEATFRTKAPTPVFASSFGSLGNGNGQFLMPGGIALDSAGNIWVADGANNRVQKLNAKGEYLSQFGSPGTGNGKFKGVADLAFTPGGDIWVTDVENARVQKFNASGEYLGQFGSYGTGNGQFSKAWGIAIDSKGNIWVADPYNNRVQEFNSSGGFIRSVTGFSHPFWLAVDSADNVWVSDGLNDRVQEISPTGQFLTSFGSSGSGNGQFGEPFAIEVKPSGDILVADRELGRVQQFSASGEYLTKFGSFSEPSGIAATSGNTTYVSNTLQSRVEKWVEPGPPVVNTQAATSVNSTEATLNGTVNPNGEATTYRFEYGTTTAYGTSVPIPDEGVGSGFEALAKSRSVGGLQKETTYHFRIVATNAEGISFGKDSPFTTALGTAGKLNAMATTEPFDGSTASVASFNANWSALGWASGTPAKGEDSTSGWHPVAAYPTVNGAFLNPTLTDTGSGIAAVATMAATPGSGSRYFSVWLDMPSPAGARAGYELRFTYVSAGTYDVTLSRWQSGTQTVLASKSSYAFANGNSFALVDEGGTVSAWTKTGSVFSQLLSASDATFSSGNVGLEGSGNFTRLTNFKAGALLSPVENMDAALKALPVNDAFATNESPLSGGGAWAALAWDNGGSNHNTGQVSGGWGPYDAYSAINGAYWQKATFADTGAGDAVAATLFGNPTIASRYFSLWLDMPSPASARSGYELRFTETSANAYEVALSKWQAGTKTVLASKAGYSFSTKSQFALVEKAGTVSAWTKTGSEYAQLLSAADSTFIGGYTGVEGSGNITRLTEFRGGPLAPF